MRVIVLKLGGSVLASEASLPAAVHEIYRWRRAGWRVVAVVSAFAGETDRLIARARALDASPWSVAGAAACGEHLAAALLGAHLDRAGVPAAVLSPAALGLRGAAAAQAPRRGSAPHTHGPALRAVGPPLESTPVSLDRSRLAATLERDGVAVVPGFAGVDAAGRTVLFGRGGSDLTALFLAAELGARCRLVKDVGGLYVTDPALSPPAGPRPLRYAAATWDDALATDGTILQHRAVAFARARRLEFEVAALHSARATRIGRGPTRLAAACTPPAVSTSRPPAAGQPAIRAPWSRAAAQLGPRQPASGAHGPLRVALLGLGTVGRGVWHLARALPGVLEVAVACSRDGGRARAAGVPLELWTDDPLAAARVGVDVVVECLGGREPARAAIAAALASGRDVVTANKLVLAEHGDALRALARESGARLRGSAAVGGSAPVLERVGDHRRRLVSVRGVLNGTANFVLEALAGGERLADALAAARARGLTEEDATRDLDGRDAADKLRVIAGALGLPPVPVEREALDADVAGRARRAAGEGRRLRQVAELVLAPGPPRARVRLVEVEPQDGLFELPGAANAALLIDAAGAVERVAGIGAGRWPTAEAVLSDLLALARAAPNPLVPAVTRRARARATPS